MRICITMRVTNAVGYDEPRDSLSQDWSKLLLGWGMKPFPVPNLGEAAADYVREINPVLLILSGGEDIGTSPVRDVTEETLLAHALATDLPVFGVCRGLQLINTAFGGRLGNVDGHVATSHRVEISDGWHDFYGREVTVNSYHNTAIGPADLSRDLVPMATDDAGMIEAARHPSKALAAVMWHPERVGGSDGDRALVEHLIGGAAAA